MRPMKRNTLLSSTVMVLALTASAWAISGGTSAYQGAVYNAESPKAREGIFNGSPKFLSIGGYYSQQKRGMDADVGTQDWKIRNTVGYIGVDVMPWLTIFGGGGESSLTINDRSNGDDNAAWIAGGTLRLLNYFALDPIIGEDTYWLSIDLDGQYTGSSADDDFGGDLTWHEVYAALLFSLTSNTERWGFMDRVAVYAGPAYSGITASQDDSFSNDLNEDQCMGLVLGVAFSPSDNITIKTELQNFDSTSWGIGASFHF